MASENKAKEDLAQSRADNVKLTGIVVQAAAEIRRLRGETRRNDPAYCSLVAIKFESATGLQLPLLLLLLFFTLTAIIQKVIIVHIRNNLKQANSTRRVE